MTIPSRVGWLTVIAFGTPTFSCTGCGDSSDLLPLNPVTGQVLFGDLPLEGAAVVFYPVGGSQRLQELRPRGMTNADGRFLLQTYVPGDGAPTGDFRVTIQWRGKPAPETSAEERHDADDLRPNLLPATLAAPESTPIAVAIANGENTLQPFRVNVTPQG